MALPRSTCDQVREFERVCGDAWLHVRAGAVAVDGRRIAAAIPSGSYARLILRMIDSHLLRNPGNNVPTGSSAWKWLDALGCAQSKSARDRASRAMMATAAAEITFGFGSTTKYCRVIREVADWRTREDGLCWPTELRVSADYAADLRDGRAYPLDTRAMLGLCSKSALAMDLYTWLAYRLPRAKPGGETISWVAVQVQFGGPDSASDSVGSWRRYVRKQLQAVRSVYPDALVDLVPGGLKLRRSRPPVPFKL